MVLVHILSQMNLFHTSPPYFLKICFGTILPFTSSFFKWSHSFTILHMHFISLPCLCMLCPYYSPLFHHFNNIWWRVPVMKLLYAVLSSVLLLYSPDILFSIHKHSLCSSVKMRETDAKNRQNYIFVYMISLLFM